MRGKKPRAHQWTHVAMYGRTSNQIHSSIYITIAGIRPCGPVRGGGNLIATFARPFGTICVCGLWPQILATR